MATAANRSRCSRNVRRIPKHSPAGVTPNEQVLAEPQRTEKALVGDHSS
jgi:hypothetical protein